MRRFCICGNRALLLGFPLGIGGRVRGKLSDVYAMRQLGFRPLLEVKDQWLGLLGYNSPTYTLPETNVT